jgi:3-hydroxymyristoyl/3-hydroxydecanoyl-(acyl carrier protein) dehydratase
VVPGVVLLDHAVEAVLTAMPGRSAAGLPSVKFTRPVQPGEYVEIFSGTPDRERVKFACRVGGNEVARGVILLADAL